RYGGDEFLIMMPETREVKSTVNRIEGELKRWNEESDLLDFPLTLAMGAARWNPDQERGVEEALKEADEKMYEDKESSNFDGHA
ncbi:diguanylate cyclase, partial [Candidatus Bipolaricaulota bacterium]|nr:diguanylate cyclase [Candidatus Bipolaricaulota bacterium]